MQLTLYSRQGCHLCDVMHQEVARAIQDISGAGRLVVHVKQVDIDSDDALRERYDWRVPVLAHEGHIICEGQFDATALQDHFDEILDLE